jgi:flagellar protein FlaG
MIDPISVNENLVINKGKGATPSQPPSSSEINANNETARITTEVDVRAQLTKDTDANKSSERVSESQLTQSLEEELKEMIQTLNEKLSRMDREVLFKVDKRIDKNYISVIDKESKEIIREFPPREIRTFIARFMEFNEKLATSTDVRSLIINLEV